MNSMVADNSKTKNLTELFFQPIDIHSMFQLIVKDETSP